MSVIVKGMDMPENCLDCQFSTDLGDCYATFSAGADFDIPNRPENCPLVALPEKHGRLIDADELIKNFHYEKEDTETAKAWIAIIRRAINHANTIVEKEG